MNFEKNMNNITNLLSKIDIDNIKKLEFIISNNDDYILDDNHIIKNNEKIFNEIKKNILNILKENDNSFFKDDIFNQGFGLCVINGRPLMTIQDTLHPSHPIVSSFIVLIKSQKVEKYLKENGYNPDEYIKTYNNEYFKEIKLYFESIKPPEIIETEWDLSRTTRRMSPDKMFMIDPGCNLICDLTNQYEAPLKFSCEGHPNRAYLSFQNPHEENSLKIIEAMEDTGFWKQNKGNYAIYMNKIETEHEKKIIWDKTIENIKNKMENQPKPYF